MKSRHEEGPIPDENDAALNVAAPQSTRRQFLKGLTTGTVAIGARAKTFKTTMDGRVVNHTEAIACLGGSALDNEEAYVLVKLMRALGLMYVEHQARP